MEKNMKTIMHKRNKQIGKKKLISNLIKPLGKFTFECALILINSMVRSSVLYGTEAMQNITEKEMRELERIEEDHLKNIFQVKTGIQVPLHLMYLELGQVPARYQVKRFKLNYLQYILQQKENSLLYKMLLAQKQNPVRNDWFSGVSQLLEEWEIYYSLEQIRNMKRNIFKSITKKKAENLAFANLVQKNKSGSKGSHIKYGSTLEMADYLCPNNLLSVEDQRELFQIRTQTNPLQGLNITCEE